MQVREMSAADHGGSNALWESVWWPTRSAAGWAWLAENPAAKTTGVPLGWVIDDTEDGLSAVLGALPQRFWHKDEPYYGLSGHSLVVTPRARGASRPLIERILTQPGFAICYTLNANVLSHRLYGRFGFVAPPGAVADRKLAWMIDPLACFMARVLRERAGNRPKLARQLGERLRPAKRLWRMQMLDWPDGIAEITPGAAYADFWERLKAEGGWLADRSPEVVRWRLADPDQTVPPVMLGYQRGGEMLGYACAMFAKENPLEPVVLEIIDLQALRDAPEAIGALMSGLMSVARARGAAKLRLSMVGPELQARLGPYAASARSEGGWQHAHVRPLAISGELSAWSPTPFDGDLFMTLRPPPRLRQPA